MISIITPTNNLKWIDQAWQSVKHQTYQDWEWVLLLNGEAKVDDLPGEILEEPRINIIRENATGNVGFLKRTCCEAARGQYILELDHDDQLSCDCLAEVCRAFAGPGAPVFVFSQCAQVRPDGTAHLFSLQYGWTNRTAEFNRVNGPEKELVPVPPAPFPQNMARIWFAPDHVRAWRADAYWAVGGHDAKLAVCDDIDLICRLYLHGPFHYIPKVLYKYLVHGENAWLRNVSEINDYLMWQVYDKYIEAMALQYWKEQNKAVLDLGGGIGRPDGWVSVDLQNADVICDLNQEWPFAASSVGVLRAHDILEHLRDPIQVMNEAHRVLCHGGLFLIEVPSTDGRGAFQDPTHVSFWNSIVFGIIPGESNSAISNMPELTAGFSRCGSPITTQPNGTGSITSFIRRRIWRR